MSWWRHIHQLQAEAAARADDVAAVRRVVEGVSESADRALATATEVQEQDRYMQSTAAQRCGDTTVVLTLHAMPQGDAVQACEC